MNAHELPVPEITLERYRLGELPAAETARVKARLEQDDGLRKRLLALDRSDEELRSAYRPDWLAARIVERRAAAAGARGSTRWRWPVALATTVAATAVLVIAVVVRGTDRSGDPRRAAASPVTERIKGLGLGLELYRRTQVGSETLADGATARTGDLLRVGYHAAGHTYGLIISIDGRGAVTRHLPPSGERAAALQRDATVLLDHAYELDDAPLWERFYFIAGDSPFACAPVVDAARRAAAVRPSVPPAMLDLPPGLEQSTITVQKETRP